MNGSELIKILRKIGKKQARAVRIDKKRGKGSHFTLYFGVKHTIMKDRTCQSSFCFVKRQRNRPRFIEKNTQQSRFDQRGHWV